MYGEKVVEKRIEWVDIAKGLAILLVIIGHSLTDPDKKLIYIKTIIASFHMPLFFILSGFTSKAIGDMSEYIMNLEKIAKKLLTPAVIIYVLRIWINENTLILSIETIKKYLYSLVYSTGISIWGGTDCILKE